MDHKCDFRSGNWDQNDFMVVRSPRWQNSSSWVQHPDCITNLVPNDLDPDDPESEGRMYVSMLYKKPLHGNIHVETCCDFEDRMAPLIVFSRELGPVYREHLEVVLFDQGINLWHHFFRDGVPSWKLIAYQKLDLKKREKYLLTAELRFTERGNFIFMGVGEPQFGCRLTDDWPQECYAGITACEGLNRFYSFAAKELSTEGVINERCKM